MISERHPVICTELCQESCSGDDCITSQCRSKDCDHTFTLCSTPVQSDMTSQCGSKDLDHAFTLCSTPVQSDMTSQCGSKDCDHAFTLCSTPVQSDMTFQCGSKDCDHAFTLCSTPVQSDMTSQCGSKDCDHAFTLCSTPVQSPSPLHPSNPSSFHHHHHPHPRHPQLCLRGSSVHDLPRDPPGDCHHAPQRLPRDPPGDGHHAPQRLPRDPPGDCHHAPQRLPRDPPGDCHHAPQRLPRRSSQPVPSGLSGKVSHLLKLLLLLLVLPLARCVDFTVKVVLVERCLPTFSQISLAETLDKATTTLASRGIPPQGVTFVFTNVSFCEQKDVLIDQTMGGIFSGSENVVVGIAPYQFQTVLALLATLHKKPYVPVNFYSPRESRSRYVLSLLPSHHQVASVVETLLMRLQWQEVTVLASEDDFWMTLATEMHVQLTGKGFVIRTFQKLKANVTLAEAGDVLMTVQKTSKGRMTTDFRWSSLKQPLFAWSVKGNGRHA
ncbi:hypothetical protein ACOMHN_065895 [Nucella lapillus]